MGRVQAALTWGIGWAMVPAPRGGETTPFGGLMDVAVQGGTRWPR